jgi:hypothetical protein
VPADWGIYDTLYNVDDSTFGFLEDVLTEVMALFPGEYIHMGGDEAVKDQWHDSPRVQAQMGGEISNGISNPQRCETPLHCTHVAPETMRDIESEMKTRVRKANRDHDRDTGNMVWAEFIHTTSRPVDGVPDPQLHSLKNCNLPEDYSATLKIAGFTEPESI